MKTRNVKLRAACAVLLLTSGFALAGTTANFAGGPADDIVLYQSSGTAVAVWPDANPAASIVLGHRNTAFRVAATGNFDGAGAADLVLCDSFCSAGANVAIWYNGNAATSAVVGKVAPGYEVVGAGDFTGDGRDDLVLYNQSTRTIAIWGAGQASNSAVLGIAAVGWTPFAIGNFGGAPNRADLVLRKFVSNPAGYGQHDISIWYDGNPLTGTIVGTTALNWYPVATGDFDGNGTDDILLESLDSGQLAYWRNGNPAFSSSPTSVGLPRFYTSTAIGDYDGDGRKDLLLYNPYNRNLVIWFEAEPNRQLVVGKYSDGYTVVPLPMEFCEIGGCF